MCVVDLNNMNNRGWAGGIVKSEVLKAFDEVAKVADAIKDPELKARLQAAAATGQQYAERRVTGAYILEYVNETPRF